MKQLACACILSAKRIHVVSAMPFCARAFRNEPLSLCVGDDLMDITDEKAVPLTKQLMDDYEAYPRLLSLLCQSLTTKYLPMGLCPQGEGKDGLTALKPSLKNLREDALATLLLSGATSSRLKFSNPRNQAPGAGNEIQLADAIDTSIKHNVYLLGEFKGARYDVGDKFGL